jgi:hypothetical protein
MIGRRDAALDRGPDAQRDAAKLQLVVDEFALHERKRGRCDHKEVGAKPFPLNDIAEMSI